MPPTSRSSRPSSSEAMTNVQPFEPRRPVLDEAAAFQRRMRTYSTGALEMAEDAQKIFVQHGQFKEGLEAIDRVFQIAGAKLAPQGLLIQGSSGAGCTSIARVFAETLPSSGLFDRSTATVHIALAGYPSAGGLVESALTAINYPFPRVSNERVRAKLDILTDALVGRSTRVLFVDKAEYLVSQRRMSYGGGRWTPASVVLRHLTEEAHLSVVLLGGLSKEQLIRVDPELAGSFPGEALTLSSFANDAVWRAFLTAFAKSMPAIDMSVLCRANQAATAHRLTQGSPKLFKYLVTEAVMVAYDNGKSAIEVAHLDLAAQRLFRINDSGFRND